MANYKPVLGDVLRYSAYCHAQGQIGINSYYYLVTEVVTLGATLDELCQVLTNQFKIVYLPVLSSAAQFVGGRLELALGGPGIAPVAAIYYNGGAGSGGANLLPTQTAGLITWKSETRGPKGQGRVYIPFPATAMSDAADLPTAGYQADLEDVAGEHVMGGTVIGGTGSTAYVATLLSKDDLLARTITSFRIAARWATQRRRGQFGAANPATIPG